MIREYGLEERVILSSFNHRSVMKCKALAPEIRCGFLTMSWLERPGEYTAARGVECYHPLYLTLDRETVDELYGHDIRINTWTVNEEADLARMKELGVDAVIGNFPDRAAAYCRD